MTLLKLEHHSTSQGEGVSSQLLPPRLTPEENLLMRLDTARGDIKANSLLQAYSLNGLAWLRELYPERLDEVDREEPKE